MAPPPPPPHALGCAEEPPHPLINSLALDELLARDPERAAALLRLLGGEAFMRQVECHAALAGVPVPRVLAEWTELFELTGESKRQAPPRPRSPRRPSINPNPNVPRKTPRTPHGPGDGRRKHWPRIRVRSVQPAGWA